MYGLPTTGISGWFYLLLAAGAGLIIGGARIIQRIFRPKTKESPSAFEDRDLKWRAQVISIDD